jgi:hypothetical protein
MEITAELRQFASDIYDELKENGEYKFTMCTDNEDLENFDVDVIFGGAKNEHCPEWWLRSFVCSKRVMMSCDSCAPEVYGLMGRMASKQHFPLKKEMIEKMEKEEVTNIIIQAIMELDNLFENVFLDTRTGCFINKKSESEMRKHRMRSTKRPAFKHRKQTDIECCVCGDETETVTLCKHRLCVRCWNKLDKLTCPMCREDVQYTNEDSD